MHAAFVLAGLGTMLLGPILPLLSARWQLSDAHAGLLLVAQFCGATLGGSTTSGQLRTGLMTGLLAGGLGFLAFAFAPGLALACAALVVAGFGVGRCIATINITAAARYTEHRGAALSWLNLSWSFGALLSPLSAASLASRYPLPHLLAGFGVCFLLVAAVFATQLRNPAAEPSAQNQAASVPIGHGLFLYFALLLFIYGGLETCLSGWLTTFAVRDAHSSLVLSQYTMVLLLGGLTGGRAFSGVLLARMRESTLQRIALLLSAGLTGVLALAQTPLVLAMFAIALGVCLAPIFPATFAIAMARRPTARQGGLILAASGIGAASLPAVMGWLSTHTGSLRLALAVPVAAALLMLALSAYSPVADKISEGLPSV